MKNKKTQGILVVFAFIVLFALAAYTVFMGVGSQHKGKASHIRLGLDLAGGVSITYQVKGDNPTDTEMNDTIKKIQQRVEQYSTEANVYKVGTNRIQVEIPGETDASAVLEELGKPGSLSFTRDASGESVILTGSDIKSAEGNTETDSTTGAKEYVVNLEFTDDGTTKFGEATTELVGQPIYIFYDGECISYPTVQEAITSGSCRIDGQDSLEEANELASYIRIGALPLELEELSSQVVAAQLGSEAITSSVKAGAIGLGIVCVFMIVIYFWPGFVASLALLAYILLNLLAINGFNVTLTLPGMAGVILGIGMAVDANVIIFTRIREEIRDGKTVKTALNSGFHKALSAIIDGNVTTLIAAVVLYFMGSGTIKGFATTLMLSIILSMVSAIFITRYLLESFYALGVNKAGIYGKAKETKVVKYTGFAKYCMVVSAIVIIIGLVMLPINKSKRGNILDFDLDFMGGTSMTLTLDEDMSVAEAEEIIKPVVVEATGVDESVVQIQAVKTANQIIVKTTELDVDQRSALQDALESDENINLAADIESENISATISSETRKDAVIAVIVALILMLLYIALRFSEWKFGLAAILALAHDVLVVFALYSVFHLTVGGTFIACMLTIVGYSINATIIIFDRIRENNRLMSIANDGLDTIVNTSISQTFTRSINTSLTTFVMVLVLYIMGANSLHEFALALMTGIVCGAYSSVCITGPLWYLFKRGGVKRAQEAAAARAQRAQEQKAQAKAAKAPAKSENKPAQNNQPAKKANTSSKKKGGNKKKKKK